MAVDIKRQANGSVKITYPNNVGFRMANLCNVRVTINPTRDMIRIEQETNTPIDLKLAGLTIGGVPAGNDIEAAADNIADNIIQNS